MWLSLTAHPRSDLQVFGVGWFHCGVIRLVAQVGGYAADGPQQVGIGVCHIDAHVACKRSEVSDVGVPGVGYLLALLVGSPEVQRRWCVDARIVHRQRDLHLEVVGEEWFVGYPRFVQPLYVGDALQAVYEVVDVIAHRQPVAVSLGDIPLKVGAPLEALLQLLPLM